MVAVLSRQKKRPDQFLSARAARSVFIVSELLDVVPELLDMPPELLVLVPVLLLTVAEAPGVVPVLSVVVPPEGIVCVGVVGAAGAVGAVGVADVEGIDGVVPMVPVAPDG